MVEQFNVVEDVGTGKGMLSCCKLINEKKYGGHVLLKIPGAEKTRKDFSIDDKMFSKLHNTEVDAYNFLQKYPDKRVSYPRIYELEKMDTNVDPIRQGHIIMEYLSGISHLYCHDYLKPDELVEPVMHLARFHSIGAELSEEERRDVPRDFLSCWFNKLFTEQNKQFFIGTWEGEMTQWLSSQVAKDTIPELYGLLTSEVFSNLNDDCQNSGVQEVLCHGDFSFHNLLYEKLDDGSYKFRAIIDFQSVNWGNAAQDLSRLFVTAMNGKDRRDSEERLLRVYYDELAKVSKGNVPPFTWEQLTHSYTKFFQLHAAIVCSVTPKLFLNALEGKKEGAEKDEFRNGMMEKYVALLEDIHKNLQAA